MKITCSGRSSTRDTVFLREPGADLGQLLDLLQDRADVGGLRDPSWVLQLLPEPGDLLARNLDEFVLEFQEPEALLDLVVWGPHAVEDEQMDSPPLGHRGLPYANLPRWSPSPIHGALSHRLMSGGGRREQSFHSSSNLE